MSTMDQCKNAKHRALYAGLKKEIDLFTGGAQKSLIVEQLLKNFLSIFM